MSGFVRPPRCWIHSRPVLRCFDCQFDMLFDAGDRIDAAIERIKKNQRDIRAMLGTEAQ